MLAHELGYLTAWHSQIYIFYLGCIFVVAFLRHDHVKISTEIIERISE